MHLPILDLDSFYNFQATMMIILFVVAIVVIFVYEYEALRRQKPS